MSLENSNSVVYPENEPTQLALDKASRDRDFIGGAVRIPLPEGLPDNFPMSRFESLNTNGQIVRIWVNQSTETDLVD